MKDKYGFKKPSFDTCRKMVKDSANKITNLEKHFGSSIDGVFLDLLVTEYVNLKIHELIEKYELLFEKQTKQSDSYGDADVTVNKLLITGKTHNHEHWKDFYKFELSGVYISDNASCGDVTKWVIIKETKIPNKKRELKDLTDEQISKLFPIEHTYHIRWVKREFKKEIDISKILTYGDLRDSGYVATFVKDKYDKEYSVKDNRSMLYFFPKFKQLMQNLNCCYYDLTEN